ncbi:MAG: response regulator transcription factor, partial [Alphaproteobacteria bacterium]|nr:response regulator transcription factor [Alphaproteobacteria bacterium]
MDRDQARKGSQTAPALDADAPHIMVVDDDDRLRKLLRRYLSENGYRVTIAGTAAEAEAKLRGLAFDLLVLDVMMPGESGVALTRRLREHMSVPILLLTAMGEPEDRIAGLESGVDDYLTKPFEPRELLLRIATILRRTRAVPPAAAAG